MERKQCSTKRETRRHGKHLAKHNLSTAAVRVIVLKMALALQKKNRHFSLLPAEHLWGKWLKDTNNSIHLAQGTDL